MSAPAVAIPETTEAASLAPTAYEGIEPLSDAERKVAANWTLRFVLTASAIFLVAGVLGMLLRNSQADLGRLDDNMWYAIMTVHGLGAFVGWAAFAVMGFAYWILASLGFALRGFGRVMAATSWITMVVGVAGIVVTTLIFDFAASWVFLYPLPFESAGQWSDWVAGLFSASVLLSGVSIITWCLSILHTVVGPALKAKSSNVLTRMGVALGFGYLWPAKFATNPRKLPYPVIPLTVIGIDMIIATLPLAVLLVIMIIQSATPEVGVNALFAKNILWFFGHPVVYLLLFPAAAAYYYLIPRYAGRPLVAGKLIAIAWAIAVVANVIVWAHHVYIDYPDGTPQAAINVAMQPLTFSLTIPSALSLYSLAFTIYKSDFKWTPGSTALFFGLVGWFLAGLSGVINATIAFDQVVHNTLWIVGHFHHMAFFNIGFLIIGAMYAFIPELTGKAWWSARAGRFHVWVTFIAGMGFVIPWLIEGLNGAPRRFAILPEQYNAYAWASIPFILLLSLAQFVFLFNLIMTLRGKGGTVAEAAAREQAVAAERAATGRKRMADASVEAVIVLVAVALAFAAGAAGWAIGRSSNDSPPASETPVAPAEPAAPAEPGAPDVEAGKDVFTSAGCAGCHALSDAGAAGAVGPNLDELAPTAEVVNAAVTNGKGAMPAFAGQLSDEEIANVSAYVAGVAGK
ncbi:MAG: cbb3-type cytochrome c oxidase subunit I [Thermoleophilia bacterium]